MSSKHSFPRSGAIKNFLERTLRAILHWGQWDIVPYASDFDPVTLSIIEKVKPYTLTSAERIAALCNAIRYVSSHHPIEGDIVECGVWKGGSMMAAALTLLEMNSTDRTLWLFDTFDGMSEPDERDVDLHDNSAADLLANAPNNNSTIWCRSPLEEVKRAMGTIGYDETKIKFVVGKVEDTLPENGPTKIALLRLDTDWYKSTYHELVHLYPRLAVGGVLIIDDYGHFKGAREAVDQYFQERQDAILLNRIDYTARIAIKVAT